MAERIVGPMGGESLSCHEEKSGSLAMFSMSVGSKEMVIEPLVYQSLIQLPRKYMCILQRKEKTVY